jgi:tetratricopeptide (TPR) repeat protein
MPARIDPRLPVVLLLAIAVLAVYDNHFQNEFHFDDVHSVTQNPAITYLHNLPRFFTDATLFSIVPAGRTWRPLVSASLAIDYWMGGGLKPFWFHLSTFCWFLVQLALMFALYRRIMDFADPHPTNFWTALFATACYGLHPANAETVNYIIQRGDLYDTLGVVASLFLFIAYPGQRKYCWYMLPAVAAYLSKAPALVFPLILLAYVGLFERGPGKRALRQTWPAWAIAVVFTLLTKVMTPATYSPGATSATLYRLTQPWVALHYFKSFFLPTELSADSDWAYVQPFSPQALAGYFFVLALLATAYYTARRMETRPICFGILWFFIALLPTSLLPLADVTTDHRMFFPFVGLALAVFWSLRLVLLPRPAWLRAGLGVFALALCAEAAGTWQRNIVWHTDESLWRDVTIKSPKNGRGWENYGNIFLARGDVATALPYLKLAATYGKGDAQGLNRTVEQNLQMALQGGSARKYQKPVEPDSAPSDPLALVNLSAQYCQNGKYQKCLSAAQEALRLKPDSAEAYNNMAAAYLSMQRWDEGIAAARKALSLKPGYEDARSNLDWALKHKPKSPSGAK